MERVDIRGGMPVFIEKNGNVVFAHIEGNIGSGTGASQEEAMLHLAAKLDVLAAQIRAYRTTPSKTV